MQVCQVSATSSLRFLRRKILNIFRKFTLYVASSRPSISKLGKISADISAITLYYCFYSSGNGANGIYSICNISPGNGANDTYSICKISPGNGANDTYSICNISPGNGANDT